MQLDTDPFRHWRSRHDNGRMLPALGNIRLDLGIQPLEASGELTGLGAEPHSDVRRHFETVTRNDQDTARPEVLAQ